MLLSIAAFVIWVAMDACVKLLAARYHVLQIVVQNAFLSLLPCLVPILLRGGGARLRTRRPGLHFLRGILFMISGLATFWAFGRMAMADVYALLFTLPLIITVLSVPIHGAKVGWRRWSAIAVGFLGVLIMLRPGSEMLTMAALVPLGAALVEAFVFLTVKFFPDDEPSDALTIYPFLVVGLLGLPLLFLVGRVPEAEDLPLFLVSGMFSGLGAYALTQAYRDGPASLVAPFQYIQMPLGIAIGFALFGDRPALWTLAGALIVIGSGLYIFLREAKRGVEQAVQAPRLL